MFPYSLAKAVLFQLDPERAHHWTINGMNALQQLGMLSRVAGGDPEKATPRTVMGLKFPNAVGLAAGMDKSGIAVDAFGAIGFGHVEIGTVTPRGQPGNPKPRLFRLPEHDAIINRMGFNNPGMEAVLENLARRKSFKGILGINIGKNFDTPNEKAIDDYLICFREAYKDADYITVNLSSPNTKGLRDLQSIDACQSLVSRLQEERGSLESETGKYCPIAVKLAPDLSDEQTRGLAEMLSSIGIDAVIATNTTIDREVVKSHPLSGEAGGLSGRPLLKRSMECLQVWRGALDPEIPIISVGGIMTGSDAQERLDAGADLVQVYTGLVFRGPALVQEIVEQTQLSGPNITPNPA